MPRLSHAYLVVDPDSHQVQGYMDEMDANEHARTWRRVVVKAPVVTDHRRVEPPSEPTTARPPENL
jgi:hypothetical protein